MLGSDLAICLQLVQHGSGVLDACFARQVKALTNLGQRLIHPLAFAHHALEGGNQALSLFAQAKAGIACGFLLLRQALGGCGGFISGSFLRTGSSLHALELCPSLLHLAAGLSKAHAPFNNATDAAFNLTAEQHGCGNQAHGATQQAGNATHSGAQQAHAPGCICGHFGTTLHCSSGCLLCLGGLSPKDGRIFGIARQLCLNECRCFGRCRLRTHGCCACAHGRSIGLLRSGVGSGGHGVGFHGLRGSQRFGSPGTKVTSQLGNLQGCPQLACGLQRVDQGVNVLGQVVDGLGCVLCTQQACICAAYVQHPLGAQVFQRTAHGGRQLAKLIGHHVSLTLQGFDDHFCGQCPLTGQLAQLTRGHAQPIGHGLGQAWGLLHDTVELFATQHARLQALDELGDGCIRRLRAGT